MLISFWGPGRRKLAFTRPDPTKQEGINVENPAVIHKSGPEIKNQCSRAVVTACRRNHSSLRRRKLESDAADRCHNGRSRRNHSSLRQRKFESDAENRCCNGRSRRNHSSLQRLRKSQSTRRNGFPSSSAAGVLLLHPPEQFTAHNTKHIFLILK